MTRKVRSNAVPVTLPTPTSIGTVGVAPVPPSFYSLGQLGDHLYSVRWELAAVGAGLAAAGLRDWDWGNGSEFQTIEEEWFAKNTRHGGMDKIGHAFSTYVIADILTDRIRANASNPVGAPITGALVAFGIMGLGETLDGFTGRHRFSREDIIANGVGPRPITAIASRRSAHNQVRCPRRRSRYSDLNLDLMSAPATSSEMR
jgi:hypothetical protein